MERQTGELYLQLSHTLLTDVDKNKKHTRIFMLEVGKNLTDMNTKIMRWKHSYRTGLSAFLNCMSRKFAPKPVRTDTPQTRTHRQADKTHKSENYIRQFHSVHLVNDIDISKTE